MAIENELVRFEGRCLFPLCTKPQIFKISFMGAGTCYVLCEHCRTQHILKYNPDSSPKFEFRLRGTDVNLRAVADDDSARRNEF